MKLYPSIRPPGILYVVLRGDEAYRSIVMEFLKENVEIGVWIQFDDSLEAVS